ncbi:hypothetical protein [Streptomyces venezuelae]|uniref:hypothetical protein n=1 Tax=Streptomyces venezuelae TaxID=54571 RepID=UPI0037CD853D
MDSAPTVDPGPWTAPVDPDAVNRARAVDPGPVDSARAVDPGPWAAPVDPGPVDSARAADPDALGRARAVDPDAGDQRPRGRPGPRGQTHAAPVGQSS